METKKPKCYKYPLYVPAEVYDFMVSAHGVGSAYQLFNLCGSGKYYHDPAERHLHYKDLRVAWYKRRRDVVNVLVWLIDWYHAAAKRTDGVCLFPNWGLVCGI